MLRGLEARVQVRRRNLERERAEWASRAEADGASPVFRMMERRARSLRELLQQVVDDLTTEGLVVVNQIYTAKACGTRAEITPLGVACMVGDYAAAKLLVRRGAHPDKGLTAYAEDGGKLTEPPLAMVLMGAQPEDAELLPPEGRRRAFCNWLLAHGARIHGVDAPWGFFAKGSLLHSSTDWAARWLRKHAIDK